jgi:hypothetical protein
MALKWRGSYLAAAAAAALLLAGGRATWADSAPTPEEYVAHVGGDARIVAPGEFVLDNHKMVCGQRPTVVDNQLDDYGAAYPGFLIMNEKLLSRLSTPVKMWIYSHECGHQFRGPDEETADCFAVQRGRRQQWLTVDGVEDICRFITPAKGDSMHFAGSHRCEAMRQCFEDQHIR